MASLPWISAIFRPGLSSLSSCTDDSRVASSCLITLTSNSLWAWRTSIGTGQDQQGGGLDLREWQKGSLMDYGRLHHRKMSPEWGWMVRDGMELPQQLGTWGALWGPV